MGDLAANIDGKNSSGGSHPETEESVQLSHLISSRLTFVEIRPVGWFYFSSGLQNECDIYSYGRHKASRSDPIRHRGSGDTHNALDLKHQSGDSSNWVPIYMSEQKDERGVTR